MRAQLSFHTLHNPTSSRGQKCSSDGGWILKRGEAFSFMGGPWRPVVKEGLLPSGVQQMLRLLINPFSLTVWNLATHRYGNSSVQGWRGMTDAARRRTAEKEQGMAAAQKLLFLPFKQTTWWHYITHSTLLGFDFTFPLSLCWVFW